MKSRESSIYVEDVEKDGWDKKNIMVPTELIHKAKVVPPETMAAQNAETNTQIWEGGNGFEGDNNNNNNIYNNLHTFQPIVIKVG